MTLFANTSQDMKKAVITDEEFRLLREFIYEQCGIFIADNRKYLVENRLAARLRILHLKSYAEYYNYLRFDVRKKTELISLYESVTTNETSFFRNPPQLDVFRKIVLPRALEKAREKGRKRLRIWTAGCSSGEEPYTLAIIIADVLGSELALWDIKITANDLSEAVLASARIGEYAEYTLRTTPPVIISKYFTKHEKTYTVIPSLKKMITFSYINLNDKVGLSRVEQSNIIFCRNVIIYFDDAMKKHVVGAFYNNLLPGGDLLIGHSETLHSVSRVFTPEHHAGCIVYRKQDENISLKGGSKLA